MSSYFMDYDHCLEFARGSIARSLGTRIGPILDRVDSFPSRVRLPDEPLMLCHRVISISGDPLSLTSGQIVTEHEITSDAWYLDGGKIPTAIAIEAGQADLLLSAYLGADLHTGGLAVYRLLDADVTFYDSLPGPGEVIRYDIRIEKFFRFGKTLFFRFQFDGTVDGALLLSMRNGCAGFFTPDELLRGRGIVATERLDESRRDPGIHHGASRAGSRSAHDHPVFARSPFASQLGAHQLDALRVGDLASAFGPDFPSVPEAVTVDRPALSLGSEKDLLPGGKLSLIHRIPSLDSFGGNHGSGFIVGESDIHPEDWFLTCHFVGDHVMPGTLMYEGCLQTLRVFLLRIGWLPTDAHLPTTEPYVGVKSQLRCRGQVTAATRQVRYEVHVKKLALEPTPHAIADAYMYADDKMIVEVRDMSLARPDCTRASLVKFWGLDDRKSPGRDQPSAPDTAECPVEAGAPSSGGSTTISGRGSRDIERSELVDFAAGRSTAAFAQIYREHEERQQFLARLPAPPFLFLDRVHSINRAPGIWENGVRCVSESYRGDGNIFPESVDAYPYAILVETALQTCGFLSAHVGSACRASVPLNYRNLGGELTVCRWPTRSNASLRTRAELTKLAQLGNVIIQHFSFAVSDHDEDPLATGTAYFGFFTAGDLAGQAGIEVAAAIAAAGRMLEGDRGERRDSLCADEMATLDAGPLRMLQRITACVEKPTAEVYQRLTGARTISPSDWYFASHFHGDPVWPGSLGGQLAVETLQVAAARIFGHPGSSFRLCSGATAGGAAPHSWMFRGQVLPTQREARVVVDVKTVDLSGRSISGDAILFVDGRPIYRLANLRLGGC